MIHDIPNINFKYRDKQIKIRYKKYFFFNYYKSTSYERLWWLFKCIEKAAVISKVL